MRFHSIQRGFKWNTLMYDKFGIYAISKQCEDKFFTRWWLNYIPSDLPLIPYLTFFWRFILLCTLVQNPAFLQCSARYQSCPHIAIPFPSSLPPCKYNRTKINISKQLHLRARGKLSFQILSPLQYNTTTFWDNCSKQKYRTHKYLIQFHVICFPRVLLKS